METNRADPVAGHETGTGLIRSSDQQKIIAVTASPARMFLPRLFQPERMRLLGQTDLEEIH